MILYRATHGGDKLKYREFILYESSQAYPEYVIKFRRAAVDARAPSDINQVKNRIYSFIRNTVFSYTFMIFIYSKN